MPLVHYAALMDHEAELLAHAVGARVKQVRKARAFTLDALAARAGVSRRMLVNVEQGSVNPSVGTLLRLSDALGVGLPALVASPASRADAVVRHGEGATLWTGDHGGRGVLLVGTEPPNVVELWDWLLQPSERHISEPHTIGTQELVHVLNGRIEVDVDGNVSDLRAGDALRFPGDVGHSYANVDHQPARFSLAVFEPGVGTARRTETAP